VSVDPSDPYSTIRKLVKMIEVLQCENDQVRAVRFLLECPYGLAFFLLEYHHRLTFSGWHFPTGMSSCLFISSWKILLSVYFFLQCPYGLNFFLTGVSPCLFISCWNILTVGTFLTGMSLRTEMFSYWSCPPVCLFLAGIS
jgi:hypothetical protein